MSDEENVVLTREELYEEVWSEPMATVAGKYGLSDVGLAKICRKLDVPVPWRGYWRKKQVGQKVKRPPLPKLSVSATAGMREVTLRRSASGSAVTEASGPVGEQQRYEALEENRILVPEQLTDPHPLVAKSVAALRRAKSDSKGYLLPKTRPCLAVLVSLDSADRAMCIYDALLKALDSRGYPAAVTTGDQPTTVVRIGEEDVAVLLEEKIERVERKPPDTPGRRRLSYGPEFDWVPTGRLSRTRRTSDWRYRRFPAMEIHRIRSLATATVEIRRTEATSAAVRSGSMDQSDYTGWLPGSDRPRSEETAFPWQEKESRRGGRRWARRRS